MNATPVPSLRERRSYKSHAKSILERKSSTVKGIQNPLGSTTTTMRILITRENNSTIKEILMPFYIRKEHVSKKQMQNMELRRISMNIFKRRITNQLMIAQPEQPIHIHSIINAIGIERTLDLRQIKCLDELAKTSTLEEVSKGQR